MDLFSIIGNKPVTMPIADALIITNNKINSPLYENIVVSVSGGSDSDVMLDMITKVDRGKRVRYIFFDTGVEYQATKNHLDYLESKYNITIERLKALKPVPLAVKNYGVPFHSKLVSEMLSRMQRHGFQWEDEPYEVLIKKYPKMSSSLKWWCNAYPDGSRFNIKRDKYLKEFIMSNPPTFPISKKCCDGAKKNTAKRFDAENNIDLKCIGIRQAEGGIRAFAYKNCFTPGDTHDNYRPIFWFTDKDKEIYKECFELTFSDCYEVWGMTRTGCAGCPFNSKHAEELEIIKKYEPKLYKACINIFGDAYNYEKKYREFKANYKQVKEKK